ncbi:glycosyltransferase family 39 protein [Thermoflexus sp.]|uniref:glycosyltransferase family 39 protein n=1 Tax=Thermoflexus sp. TaxID=1969742 RepID=UPI002ADE92D3|nr:glycosyltransferase family 39 protein [Thermoflexus sp.]
MGRAGRAGRWPGWIGLAVLLLGMGLRFYRLEAQSLWYDEGTSARLSEGPLRHILESAAQDIHPPLYYVLLYGWGTLVGRSVFALRAFSALTGVLLIAAVGNLTARLFGRRAAGLAMLLTAVHPLAIYYAQETRMYTLLGLWAAWHSVFWLAWQRRPRPGRALGLLLTGVAGWYTHYVFPAIPVAHFLGMLIDAGRGRLRRLIRWLGLQAWIGLAVLPWAPVAMTQLRQWPSPPQVPLPEALEAILRALGAGITLPPEVPSVVIVPPLIGIITGIIGKSIAFPKAPRGANPLGVWMALTMVLSPIGLVLGRGAYREANLKFFMAALPAFVALGAAGLETIRWLFRKHGGIGAERIGLVFALGLMLGPMGLSLQALYFDPRFARDDYRGLARTLAAILRPGDGVLLYAPGQVDVFTYYWPEAPLIPAPLRRPPPPEEIEGTLAPALRGRDRLFVLWYGEREADPEGRVERWLDTHAFRAEERWVGGIRLAVYGLGKLEEHPAPGVRFGEAIEVDGWGMTASPLRPGDVLGVAVRWRVLASIPTPYKVFVHVRGPDGRPVAQTDREPLGWRRPTTTWRPGEILEDRYGVWLPTELMPGRYPVVIGFYGPDGRRLPVFRDGQPAGEAWEIGIIEIRPVP